MSRDFEDDSRSDPGSFQCCLVDGSAEQRARERRIRRRSLTISIAIQTAIVTAIILVPLFGKPERFVLAYAPTIPLYRPMTPIEQRSQTAHPTAPRNKAFINPYLAPTQIPPHVPAPGAASDPEPPAISAGPESGALCPACIPIVDSRPQPVRPADARPRASRIFKTQLEQAMLMQRVEPLYPPLARQIHREGTVELHAIIGTDGTIQSLQVVSGDALFVQSALNAVRQWRYHPTILDGQPVEVETYITVSYVLQR